MNREGRIALAVVVGAWILKYLRPIATVTTDWDWQLPNVSYSPAIQAAAQAIAKAEGFYVPNSIPARAHNPGNLKIPGWTGPTLGGGICVFDSDGQGWAALHRQLQMIVDGRSQVYSLDMTLSEMGRLWTATATEQAAWSNNVASFLGVEPDQPLWSVLV